MRSDLGSGPLIRAGFQDVARGPGGAGRPRRPCGRAARATGRVARTRTWRCASLVAPGRGHRRPGPPPWSSSARTRAPPCAWSRCWGPARRLGDHLVRHPEQWRELADSRLRLHPARRPGGCAPSCWRQWVRTPRTRSRSSRLDDAVGRRRAAGGVPPAPAPPGRPRPRPPPGCRRPGRRALRPGGRHPGRRTGGRPGQGRRGRRDGAAGGGRDGQVRRARAQLRLRRRRDLRARAASRGSTRWPPPGPRPSWPRT